MILLLSRIVLPVAGLNLPPIPEGVAKPSGKNALPPWIWPKPADPLPIVQQDYTETPGKCEKMANPSNGVEWDSYKCTDARWPICKEGTCDKCSNDDECRDLANGSHRRPIGLYFCREGQCQGLLGDDDITAYGNNQHNAIWGTANDVHMRVCTLDEPRSLKEADSPSVRKLSNDVHDRPAGAAGMKYQTTRDGTKKNPRVANLSSVFFGQFVDHDVTLMAEEHDKNSDISDMLEEGDKATMDKMFLPALSLAAEDRYGPDITKNEITSFLDGSNIYASDPWKLNQLRLKPAKGCRELDATPDMCEPDCMIYVSPSGERQCQPKMSCHQHFLETKECDRSRCVLKGKNSKTESCHEIPGTGINGLLAWHENKDKGREILPSKVSGGGCNGSLLEAGDDRASENTILATMHTLFFREHNRIARAVKIKNPDWDDLKIFQFARKCVRASYQIIFDQWLEVLIDPELFKFERYDPNQSPQISAEFAGAAFRFGHSSLPEEFLLKGHKSLRLHQLFSNIEPLFDNFDGIVMGTLMQAMEKADTECVPEIRNMLFSNLPFNEDVIHPAGTEDLVSRNLQRGRMLKLPPFQDAHKCAAFQKMLPQEYLNAVKDKSIITNQEMLDKLTSIYEPAGGRIDMFTGLLAEESFDEKKNPNHFGFPRMLEVIIAEQFGRLKKGDRFWYENLELSEEYTHHISGSFAQLIRRNTNVHMKGDGFTRPMPSSMSIPDSSQDCNEACNKQAMCPPTDDHPQGFCTQWAVCCKRDEDRPGCDRNIHGHSKHHSCVSTGEMPTFVGSPTLSQFPSVAFYIRPEEDAMCPVMSRRFNKHLRECDNGHKIKESEANIKFKIDEDAITDSPCNTVIYGGVKRCSQDYPVMCNKRQKYEHVCAKTVAICEDKYDGVLGKNENECPADNETCGSWTCTEGTTKNLQNKEECKATGCTNEQCCTGNAIHIERSCDRLTCKRWEQGLTLADGKCVSYNGTFYRALKPIQEGNIPGSETSDWAECGEVPTCTVSEDAMGDVEGMIKGKCFHIRSEGGEEEQGEEDNEEISQMPAGEICYHTCEEDLVPFGHFTCKDNKTLRAVNVKCRKQDHDDCPDLYEQCIEPASDATEEDKQKHKEANKKCPIACDAVRREHRQGINVFDLEANRRKLFADVRQETKKSAHETMPMVSLLMLVACLFLIVSLASMLILQKRTTKARSTNAQKE